MEMRDVLITIQTYQSLDPDRDGTELITAGKLGRDEEGYLLSYEESALTGMQGTETSFLVKPDEIVLSRRGTVTSQMVFRQGQKQHFAYETPFGTLTMGLDTYKLSHDLNERGGQMDIEYDLDFDRAVVSRNRFHINVREARGN